MLPYYLMLGMSIDDYWNGDPQLAKYYRKSDKLKQQRMNEQLWLQGLYIYEAISDLAPILQAFAKKGTKARPYPEKPYPMGAEETGEPREEVHADEQERKGLEFMKAFMAANNAKYKKDPQAGAIAERKESDGDGGT